MLLASLRYSLTAPPPSAVQENRLPVRGIVTVDDDASWRRLFATLGYVCRGMMVALGDLLARSYQDRHSLCPPRAQQRVEEALILGSDARVPTPPAATVY